MSFDEVRLPEDVERGAQGGPRFLTTIVELTSGFEKRNQDWANSRALYDISYGIQTQSDYQVVLAFFYARRGRARGFRFKDWSDYTTGTSQLIFNVGDDTTSVFQLRRPYTDAGGNTFYRDITKPVDGTVRIFIDGLETTAFSLDTTTGLVTFTAAPALDAVLTWVGEYDVPVRFDTDDFQINLEYFDAGSVPSIPLVEIRV